jgi:hypothetical protein
MRSEVWRPAAAARNRRPGRHGTPPARHYDLAARSSLHGFRRQCRRRKRGPGSQKPPRWSAGRRASRVWDARRLACRVGTHNGCSAEHPNVSRRSAHPSTGVSEAKRQSPDAAMRARERDGLFDIVKNAAGDVRPHPEERARENLSANSNVRARVSKDEDEQSSSPSCFETHRSAVRQDMHSRRAAMALSMRAAARAHFGETNPTRGCALDAKV